MHAYKRKNKIKKKSNSIKDLAKKKSNNSPMELELKTMLIFIGGEILCCSQSPLQSKHPKSK